MRPGVKRHSCACGAEKRATGHGSRDFQAFQRDQKPFSFWIAARWFNIRARPNNKTNSMTCLITRASMDQKSGSGQHLGQHSPSQSPSRRSAFFMVRMTARGTGTTEPRRHFVARRRANGAVATTVEHEGRNGNSA
jgi:hypothetical protein